MSTIGWSGVLILALVVLLVFGPRRLPELGRQLGRGVRELRRTVGEPASEIRAALEAPREARAALTPGAQVKAALSPQTPAAHEEAGSGPEGAGDAPQAPRA